MYMKERKGFLKVIVYIENSFLILYLFCRINK